MPDDARSETRDWWRVVDPAGGPGDDSAAGRLSRRDFVKLVGAGAATMGVAACSRPAERILPYVDDPPELTPGVPQHYATSMVLDGHATGLVVESHAGRPTKVEGNPEHPASLGAAGIYEQASVFGLYDPQRAKQVNRRGAPAGWSALQSQLGAARADGGAGLRVLLPPTASPLLGDLLTRLRARYPAARVYFHAPLDATGPAAGARAAFGRVLQPVHDFSAADVVVSLDSDFAAQGPFNLRYARQLADRRAPHAPTAPMSRLYVAEPSLTPTGALADHRLPVRASEIPDVAAALASALLGQPLPPTPHRAAVEAAARELRASAGRGVVVAGDRQPPEVHALVHLANSSLGNVGRTVSYVEPTLLEAGEPSHDLAGLVEEMNAGRVDTLLILESNPVYTAPADLDFAGALRRVPHSVRLGLYRDETARACEWTAPAVHYLEAWGDARAYDGTVSFVQPLVAPLYGGKTPAELLSMVLGQPASAHDLLTAYWRGRLGGGSQRAWEEALQRGVVPGTAAAAIAAAAAPGALAPALAAVARSREARTRGVEIVFERDAKLYDGRFANNPWLQELPEPITKVTWENTAVISPATARRLGVETGRMLRLEHAGRSVSAPAYVLPGHADDSATVQLGYGRGEGDEAVATGRGFDAYRLRTREAPHVATGARVSALPESRALATTQGEFELHGRPVVLSATLAAYRADPEFTHEHRGRTLSLYSPYQDEYRTGNQWAMAIDLTRCTGCSACVIACVAENNIPVVGRSEVLKNREMHWLRIDRYFTGDPAAPAVAMQPMLCQHCEHAPCEYVCPVNATVHSDEGLNQMVYNRCVGTRFCSNNCPYKVRRFNWLNYTGDLPASEQLAMNPDVTVRARGVMEKCSFCVQRIRETEIHAQLEGRAVRPGEVVTACQQTCPTRAIVFGSYTDPDPELAARLADPRRYAVLHDLGTQPRVRYLAKISNPNPALPHQDSGSRIQDSGGPGTEDRRPTADDRGGEGREGGLRG